MNNNPILTLNLSINEINAILAAIQELPAKVCNPLTEKIKVQAIKQIPVVTEEPGTASGNVEPTE